MTRLVVTLAFIEILSLMQHQGSVPSVHIVTAASANPIHHHYSSSNSIRGTDSRSNCAITGGATAFVSPKVFGGIHRNTRNRSKIPRGKEYNVHHNRNARMTRMVLNYRNETSAETEDQKEQQDNNGNNHNLHLNGIRSPYNKNNNDANDDDGRNNSIDTFTEGDPELNFTDKQLDYVGAGTLGDIMSEDTIISAATITNNSINSNECTNQDSSAENIPKSGLVTSTGGLQAQFGHKIPNLTPLDRIALTANGNLQRICSSYYDAPVHVYVESSHF